LRDQKLPQRTTEAGVAIGYLMGAALLTIPAMVLLLMALAAFLVEIGMGVVAADLSAGAFGLLISALVGVIGFSKLKPETLFPARTVNQLQRDFTAIKEHL